MSALAFALALASSQPLGQWAGAPPPTGSPSWYGTAGRIVTTPSLHVGLRPALYVDNENNGGLELAAGATLQVTFSKGAW